MDNTKPIKLTVLAPASVPAPTIPDNYAFVMNIGRLIGAASQTIVPGHELRRATTTEIDEIKEVLAKLAPPTPFPVLNCWEQPHPHPGGRITALPPADWKYFVIAFQGPNATMSSLLTAFDLAPRELEVGFTVLKQAGGGLSYTWNGGRLIHVLEDIREFDRFIDVTSTDLIPIREAHAKLQRHDHGILNLNRPTSELVQLKGLPHDSPLRFLGYFAVLESLLTHAPKPSDPYDSITRQVKKKIVLIANRLPAPIDYSAFGGAASDTIWGKMYQYRSLIAHGGAPQFAGELALLKDAETAMKLIQQATKAVILAGLNEPRLLLDLREC